MKQPVINFEIGSNRTNFKQLNIALHP